MNDRRFLVSTVFLLSVSLAGCRAVGGVPATACDRISSAQVVAIGESHDKMEHHLAERDALLCMLRGARKSGAPVLLGMEMFQRPFQAPLDDYVAGRIDEAEMLRLTEYATRWRFDPELYAPLWRTARQEGVRIIALNVPAEIATKVGRQGLDALTLGERLSVARTVDLDVPSHNKRIRGYFGGGGAHGMSAARIDTLYQAQTLWDETMAETAAVALEAAGEGARMLVVAGSYHVQEFDGIPDRIARRRPLAPRPLVVVLRYRAAPGEPADDGPPDAELADIVLRVRASKP